MADWFEGFTELVNNYLSPLLPYAEKYWMFLAGVPLILILYLVFHYGYGLV